ncbi:MAG: hypothetical protein ACK5R5_02075 [Alphaproteobacteria bacterium]|jgi:hypothetical protein
MEPMIPERRALLEQLRDLLNWRECLKRSNPTFAKRFIMDKLRPSLAIDDFGTHWLIKTLALEAA